MPDTITAENEHLWGRCVKCGKPCEWIPDLKRHDYRYPPKCAECALAVIKEVFKGYGMWPHNWYGHSMFNEVGRFYTRGIGWNEPMRFKRPAQ